MQKTIGRILKSDEVKFEGRFQLNVPQAELKLPGRATAASVIQHVRIVENHPCFAVIEITCCCARKTYLKCEYAGSESSAENGQIQNAAFEVAQQVPNPEN